MSDRSPTVSVVVPVKRSQKTIRLCVESLLHQDYEGIVEVILVGDYRDPTWEPIKDIIREKLITAITVEVRGPGRDSNAKRNVGLHHAAGEILALTDSDMVLPRHWVRTGVDLIQTGWSSAAGSMISVDSDFWGNYVDYNYFGSKTPRMNPPYDASTENIGIGRYKPPITANVFFTRELFETVGEFDHRFVWTYDDYEFFERVAEAGFHMFCTNELAGLHHHRKGFRSLINEYKCDGQGCADFIKKYPKSHLRGRRVKQLIMLIVAGLTLPFVPLLPFGWQALLAGLGVIMVGSMAKTRRLEGLIYPFVTAILGTVFVIQMGRGLISRKVHYKKRDIVIHPPKVMQLQ